MNPAQSLIERGSNGASMLHVSQGRDVIGLDQQTVARRRGRLLARRRSDPAAWSGRQVRGPCPPPRMPTRATPLPSV